MPKHKTFFQPSVAYEKDIVEPSPSQRHRVIEEDKSDSLIDWQIEEDIYILASILLVGIILVVGLIFRKVENVLLIALFISGVIIVLFFALLG